MKLLFIAPLMPYPIVSGAELPVYWFTKLFAARHDLTMVCQPSQPPTDAALAHMRSIVPDFHVFSGSQPAPTLRRNPMRDLFDELFGDPARLVNPDRVDESVRRAIERLAVARRFDGVLVFGFGLRAYGADLSAPMVVDLCDSPTVFLRSLIRHEPGLRRKASLLREWLLMRRFERRTLGRLHDVLMVSSSDAAQFGARCPRVRVTVVPNGVDADYYARGAAPQALRPTLIFTGVMSYPPNVTAAVHAARRVLPLVRRQVPEARLRIVGRNPSPVVRQLASIDGVEVTGAVDDIREAMRDAMIYVSPLRSGAGIKNKILEAWSMELPIVATSRSCDGLEVRDADDIFVRDTPREFADAVVRLIRDEPLRAQFARAGRRKVLSRYDWNAQATVIEDLFRRLASAS